MNGRESLIAQYLSVDATVLGRHFSFLDDRLVGCGPLGLILDRQLLPTSPDAYQTRV